MHHAVCQRQLSFLIAFYTIRLSITLLFYHFTCTVSYYTQTVTGAVDVDVIKSVIAILEYLFQMEFEGIYECVVTLTCADGSAANVPTRQRCVDREFVLVTLA